MAEFLLPVPHKVNCELCVTNSKTHTHTHIYMCTHICMYTHTCKHNVTIFSNVQVRGHLLQIKTCIKISAFDTSLNGKQSTDRHEFSVGMMGKVSLLQYVFIKKSSHSNVPHIYVCQMQQYVSTLSLIIYKRSQVKHWTHHQAPSYLLHVEPQKNTVYSHI